MSTASRLLLFGTSVFHCRTNKPSKTLTPIPSFLSSKPFPSFQFNLYSTSSAEATTTTSDADISDTLNSLQQQLKQRHPWPEWVSFVDTLKTRGYFVGTSIKEEDNNSTGDDEVGIKNVYNDMNRLKTACLSFARDRYDVFKSLSIPDIQTLVERGCPNVKRKYVNSGKRLRAYVGLDEGKVCGACHLRDSCDRAYVILKGNEAEGHTVDILRILMSYALDPLVISGEERSPGRELIEASTRKLLSELIELSETPFDPALLQHTPKASHEKEQDVDFMDGTTSEHAEMKEGDWICPKCNFMNFSRNKSCRKCREESTKKNSDTEIEMKKGDWICSECQFMNFSRNLKCLKCRAEGPTRISVDDVEMKKGDWNCIKCGFMNFASNKKCLRCRDPRPKRTTGEWHCPKCDFLNFSRNKSCLKCNCERPPEEEASATTDYEELLWKSPC